MSARVEALFLKTGHGQPVTRADSVTAVAGAGFAGDLSFGRTKRQVLVIEAETLDAYGVQPGDLKENVVIRGLPLAGAPPGSTLRLGPAVLQVTMDCAPCEYVDSLQPGLRAELDGRRGTLFKVLSGGEIKPGDPVSLELVPASMAAAADPH